MPTLSPKHQRGFSVVEVIVAIVVVAILATAFMSAFSTVLKTSASPLQNALMESIAASEINRVLSGTFQSAVLASSPTPTTVTIDGTSYQAFIAGESSVVNGATISSGVHLTVTVTTDNCISCVSLSGDTFDVQ